MLILYVSLYNITLYMIM